MDKYECKCGRIYTKYYELNAHLDDCKMLNKVSCIICGSIFYSSKELNEHIVFCRQIKHEREMELLKEYK